MPCKSCRDWHPADDAQLGECRRFPPQIYAIAFAAPQPPSRLAIPQGGQQINVTVNTQPPMTRPDFECREYERWPKDEFSLHRLHE